MPLWWVTKDGDFDCLDMYLRHYSRAKRVLWRKNVQFVGPGEHIVLRTETANAVFVWRRFIDDSIDQRTGERQQGVNCAVFRNESEHLSSQLVEQADRIADAVWTDRRHYTYVNRQAVASSNPGYCFIRAGWRRCGMTKSGLLVLERITSEPSAEAGVPAGDPPAPLGNIERDQSEALDGINPATRGHQP